MILCLLVQVATVLLAVRYFARPARGAPAGTALLVGFVRIASVMVLLMAGVILQITIWAMLYRLLGLLADFETALYFSGVTFTSLGFGDIVLPPPARLLAPLEAATGLLMFGITTAVLIGAMQVNEKAEAEARDLMSRAPKNAPPE